MAFLVSIYVVLAKLKDSGVSGSPSIIRLRVSSVFGIEFNSLTAVVLK